MFLFNTSWKQQQTFWFYDFMKSSGFLMISGGIKNWQNTGLQLYIAFQLAFTCSKLTTEILEQGVKYVQS